MRKQFSTLTLMIALIVALPLVSAADNSELAKSGFQASASISANDIPNRDASGGPDQGGYSWRDDQERGVTYDWIDISEIGTRLAAGDDWNSGVLNLGWNFNWYGQDYGSFRVCSNGWVSLDPNASQSSASLPQCPNANAPNAVFCVNNYDLNPAMANSGGNVYWYTNGQDLAVVTYDHVVQYGQINNWQTFQVIFRGDGTVTYQYAAFQNVNGSNSNIGFESPNGQMGLNISYRQANFLHAEMAIKIAQRFIEYDGPGIAITPEQLDFPNTFIGYPSSLDIHVENNGAQDLVISGLECDVAAFILPEFQQEVVISSGESIDTQVGFDPDQEGEYSADIRVLSNAENADQGITVIAAHGFGMLRPAVDISSNAFEEEMVTGDVVERTLTLTNNGGSDLEYSTDFTVISENERDNGLVRSLRSVGPVRDELNRDARGGPDNIGYEWRTSDDRLGPNFEWIDITENGQRLQAGDDWNSGVLALGWNFPWY